MTSYPWAKPQANSRAKAHPASRANLSERPTKATILQPQRPPQRSLTKRAPEVATMTKRTKSMILYAHSPSRTNNLPEVGVTGKYGTISLIPSRVLQMSHGFAQIWRLPSQAGEEDGNFPARPLHVHILWQDHRQARCCGYLELQVMQEDDSWRCLDRIVGLSLPTHHGKGSFRHG